MSTSPPPPGRLIDIGGFRLHIHSAGEGSPVVVLVVVGWVERRT